LRKINARERYPGVFEAADKIATFEAGIEGILASFALASLVILWTSSVGFVVHWRALLVLLLEPPS
jgi:hypothetical protein